MQYNAANQLSVYQNNITNNTVLNSFNYTYDPAGNITQISTPDGNIMYSYDSLNQLTKETLENGDTYTYGYDSVGNRISKQITSSTGTITNSYKFNAANELIDVNGQAYLYDKNGNLIDDGKYLYTWDANDNLIQIKSKSDSSVVAQYKYDQDNRRIQKIVSGVTTNYTYDGESNRILFETDSNGNLIQSYTYDDKGELVTLTDSQGKVYYYLFNGHGDVIGLTDSTGNIVAQYKYDSWGNILSQSGSMAAENPYRYAGYRYDFETGLYYLMARYYNPEYGVFLSLDPDGGDNDKPLTENGYSYANNNPVNEEDPSGESALLARLLLLDSFTWEIPGVDILMGSATVAVSSYEIYRYAKSRKSSTSSNSPIGRAGRKKQSREVNEKKREKHNFKSRSNKNPNRAMKKHTPSRKGHTKHNGKS